MTGVITSRRENGAFIYFTEHGETHYKSLQCGHCGLHWQVVKGNEGGWCLSCMKPICYKQICNEECVPYEAQMEIEEGNRKTLMLYGQTKTAQRIFQKLKQMQNWDAIKNILKKYPRAPILK